MSDISRHILRTFASKVLYALVSIVASIIIARILGPAGKGEYTIVLLVSSMVVSLGSMNIGDTAIYFFNKKKINLGTILASNSMFILSSSLIYAAIVFCLWKLDLLPWNELSRPYLIFFACLLIPLIFLRVHLLDILRCNRQFNAYNYLFLAQPLIYLIVVIFFVYFLNLHVIGVLLSYTITLLIIVALSLLFIFSQSKISLELDLSYMKAGLYYGLKGHVGNIFQKFNTRLDQFFISPYWGIAMLGNYSVAVTLSELIFYIPDSIGIITLTSIAGSEKEEAEHLTAKSLRITVALTLILIGLLYLVARPGVLLLYGAAFEPAVRAIYYLLPGIFFVGISKILSKYFSGAGHPEINTYTSTVSSAATIILCIVLIPEFGIIGAAVASSLAYALRAFCDIIIFVRVSKTNLRRMFVINKEDIVSSVAKVRQIIL